MPGARKDQDSGEWRDDRNRWVGSKLNSSTGKWEPYEHPENIARDEQMARKAALKQEGVSPAIYRLMEEMVRKSPFGFPSPSPGMIPQEDAVRALRPEASGVEALMDELDLGAKDRLQTYTPPEWRDPQRDRKSPMDPEEFVKRLRGHYSKRK